MRIATTEVEPRVLIVGAGATGRELARRLAAHWRIAVVDLEEQKLASLAERIDRDRLRVVAGDGTSRLVLEKAGAAHVDYVVAATGSDEANLEVCRIARASFGKTSLYAVVVRMDALGLYREVGIDTVSPAHAASVSLESRIVRGAGTSLAAGEGRGEVIEVTVLPSSPVVGRTLSTLHPQRCHVAAIYRQDELIVPTGNTVIERRRLGLS